MASILPSRSIYYNDVNLIAQSARKTAVDSRGDVQRELQRIIVSPMASVVGYDFAKEATELGLTVCLHRFCPAEEQVKIFKSIKTDNVFVSVGCDDQDRIKKLLDIGATKWILDVANGYLPKVIAAAEKLAESVHPKCLIVGNVMTQEGVDNYAKCKDLCDGNLWVRVGIAGGKACSTSDMTGYNRGQITEIMECSENESWIPIIADGGIKNSNYASKAFGAGADYCMMGAYFAMAKEAHTHRIGDGTYWGGASHKQQSLIGKLKRHSEGKVIKLEGDVVPLKQLVDDLWGGISSAILYSPYPTLSEFIGNGIFEIKQNSLAPRDLR